MIYPLLLWVHILGASVLLGTGAGIAFFMVMAHRGGDPKILAHVGSTVVIADFLFTASAVVLQPISGGLLAYVQGWPITTPWIFTALALYVLTGFCWLPVVWIQVRMRDLARIAAAEGRPLSANYHRLFRIWFALGFPAFASVLAIFWLMIDKPMLWGN